MRRGGERGIRIGGEPGVATEVIRIAQGGPAAKRDEVGQRAQVSQDAWAPALVGGINPPRGTTVALRANIGLGA
jgi:hypothetical protein